MPLHIDNPSTAAHNADAGAHDLASSHVSFWGDSLTVSISSPYNTVKLPRTLSEYATHMHGVGGETSTQIKARFALAVQERSCATVIWAGTNNRTATAQVLADVSAMVAALGHQNYLVLSVVNSNDEISGSGNHTAVIATNAALAAAFGDRYFDVRSWWVAQYNPAIPQDVTDFGNDVTPTSLRVDTIHPNAAGVVLLVGKLAAEIRARLPVSSTGLAPLFRLSQASDNLDIKRGKLLRDGSPVFAVDDANNISVGEGTASASTITTGAGNISMGANAGGSPTTAIRNISLGNLAGASLGTASDNISLGDRAGAALSSGSRNLNLGAYAGNKLTTSSQNQSIGYYALSNATLGSFNFAGGTQAGNKITIGSSNSFVGHLSGADALQKVDALQSTAIGYGSYTTADNQVAIGGPACVQTVIRGKITALNIPTSSAGLTAGDIWSDGGILKIAD